MSPEEVLEALAVKAAECRELLADMRSMEKTLRATTKEAAELVADVMDEGIRKEINRRADEHFEVFSGEMRNLEKRVIAKVTKEAMKLLQTVERALMEKGLM